jgi:hypothetical protein
VGDGAVGPGFVGWGRSGAVAVAAARCCHDTLYLVRGYFPPRMQPSVGVGEGGRLGSRPEFRRFVVGAWDFAHSAAFIHYLGRP